MALTIIVGLVGLTAGATLQAWRTEAQRQRTVLLAFHALPAGEWLDRRCLASLTNLGLSYCFRPLKKLEDAGIIEDRWMGDQLGRYGDTPRLGSYRLTAKGRADLRAMIVGLD